MNSKGLLADRWSYELSDAKDIVRTQSGAYDYNRSVCLMTLAACVLQSRYKLFMYPLTVLSYRRDVFRNS